MLLGKTIKNNIILIPFLENLSACEPINKGQHHSRKHFYLQNIVIIFGFIIHIFSAFRNGFIWNSSVSQFVCVVTLVPNVKEKLVKTRWKKSKILYFYLFNKIKLFLNKIHSCHSCFVHDEFENHFSHAWSFYCLARETSNIFFVVAYFLLFIYGNIYKKHKK